MAYGLPAVYSDTIASAASTSSGIIFKANYEGCIGVQVGTFSTSAQIAIQHSVDDGTTWYNIYQNPINTSSAQVFQLLIGSGVGTNGGYVQLPYGKYAALRFIATGTITNGGIFKVVCGS